MRIRSPDSESAACASRVEKPNPTGDDHKWRTEINRASRRKTGGYDRKPLFPSLFFIFSGVRTMTSELDALRHVWALVLSRLVNTHFFVNTQTERERRTKAAKKQIVIVT